MKPPKSGTITQSFVSNNFVICLSNSITFAKLTKTHDFPNEIF